MVAPRWGALPDSLTDQERYLGCVRRHLGQPVLNSSSGWHTRDRPGWPPRRSHRRSPRRGAGRRVRAHSAVPGRPGTGREPASRRQPSRPAPLESRETLSLRVVKRSFERIERRSVDHVGQRAAHPTSPLSRRRLVDQAQVSTGTHTMASKLAGGHAKSAVGINDDLEPFSILRSRHTHGSRIVPLLSGAPGDLDPLSRRGARPLAMLNTPVPRQRVTTTSMIVFAEA